MCSPIDRKRQSVDQFLVGNHLVLTGRDTGRYSPSFGLWTFFDYGIPAELFMGKRKGGARQPLRYRRFATAAEAIRFAIEELPAVRALDAWMQVGGCVRSTTLLSSHERM